MWIGHRKDIHSDEELTRKTSALESLSDEQFILRTQLTKTNYLAIPPINAARNSPPPPLFICCKGLSTLHSPGESCIFDVRKELKQVVQGFILEDFWGVRETSLHLLHQWNDNLQGKNKLPFPQNITRTLGLESPTLPLPPSPPPLWGKTQSLG